MVKNKKGENANFKIRPETDKEQMALDVFYCLKQQDDFNIETLAQKTRIQDSFIKNYLDQCSKKGLVSYSGESGGVVRINDQSDKSVLGIGFREGLCFLSVMSFSGKVTAREEIGIDLLIKSTGKNKDISGIAKEIAERTEFKDKKFECAGMAVPEEMITVNPKSIHILTKGVSDIFGCKVLSTKSATASGYGDRDFCPQVSGKNILYMYSDVGIGVIFKKESIFEADEYTEDRSGAYLRPWNHFSIVNTTKDLVLRGVGTDIVEMVKGDVDRITMDVVLKAADGKDELALDLVKRSGLALGVRVAYLLNMFGVEYVLFGGGTEKGEGGFIESVRESMSKFLTIDVAEKLKVIPGVLGKESSSIGAASLCRREMFMEV